MSQTHVKPDRESPPSAPRWVKVSAIIVIILILLFAVLQLAGIGGSHGPDRHIPPSEPGGYIIPGESSDYYTLPIEHGVQQL